MDEISDKGLRLIEDVIGSQPEKFKEIDSIEFMDDLDRVIITMNKAGIYLNTIQVLLGWSVIESLYHARKKIHDDNC